MQSAFTLSLNYKPSTPHRQDRNRTAPGEKEKPQLLTGAELGRGRLVYWTVIAARGCHPRRARAQRREPPSPEKRSTIQRSADSPCSRTMATSLPSSRM